MGPASLFPMLLAALVGSCAAFSPAALSVRGVGDGTGRAAAIGRPMGWKGQSFRLLQHGQRGAGAGVRGLLAGEGGIGMNEIGDLAILGALQKLRGGIVQKRRTIHFPGCINESYKFQCESRNFFVKINRSVSANQMFEGEAGSLQGMRYAGMSAPRPLRAGDLPQGGSYLIMEHVDFQPFVMMESTSQSALGEQLAAMHLHQPERHQFFGFGLPTRLGTTPMDNDWSASWASFFVDMRLRPAFDRLREKGVGTESLHGSADEVCERAMAILRPLDGALRPSILHGDLWLGNAGMSKDGQVSVYDPSSFYGHSEFDLSFRGWPAENGFPGFSDAFYTAYHFNVPREEGFEERGQLYQLFHLLNHASIYGEEYTKFAEDVCKRVLSDSMAP